jgi:PAS domain S-box-containing protein
VEGRLAASEERFTTAIEAMVDGFAIFVAVRNASGKIVDFRIDFLNDAACRILGVSRDQILGSNMVKLFPSHDPRSFGRLVRVVEAGEPFSMDNVLYDWPPPAPKNPSSRAFDCRASRLEDGFALTFRDVTDRKHAEDELFASKEMLGLVLDTIPQRVFWKDTNSVFVGCNVAFAANLGLGDPSELIGKTDFDLNGPVEAELYRADDRRVMASGVPKVDYEEPHTRPDGSPGWARTSKVPLTDADGEVVGLLGTYEDITDRKRAEDSLERSERFLNSIINNIPHMIFVKDSRDLRFVEFNRAGEQLMGLNRSEIIGKSDYDLSPGPEAEFFLAKDREVLARGEILDIPEEAHTRGPAGARVLHTKKIPILDEEGNPLYLLGIAEDITDRKRAEEALRESEERYRRITETITDYVFTVRVEDGVAVETVHGAGCVAVTGYTPEELASNPGLWINMVEPDDREAVSEQAREILRDARVGSIEHRIVRKDGAQRWVRNTPVPRLDASGRLVAYHGLIQDITERRALQDQLLHAQKMEGIGRLAGGVAHNFNNLLTAILGYVEMSKMDLPTDLPDDHPVRQDLAEIAAAGQRAASLTRQLLSFAAKQIVAPVRFDLSSLVADSLNMLRRLLGDNIEITALLEPGLGSVKADSGQIQQVLVNLAVNAGDAMPDGGRLVIETAAELVDDDYAESHPGCVAGWHVRLTVTDTGSGMTEEVRSHLFEPFYTTKARGKGTGLGLATCHGIVQQMGGHIRVYTELGQGTSFRIFLPMVDGPVDQPAAGCAEPAPSGTETVMVVEDEPSVRRLAVLALRARGYSVLEAADGAAALDVARRVGSQLDLVVSDVVMPGISGPELVKRLAVIVPGAKALLMSGHAKRDVLPGDLDDLSLAFLPKPFTPDRLARKVRDVIDGRES